MNIPTKDEVEAAKAKAEMLWIARGKSEAAIRAAAGPDLCAEDAKVAREWYAAHRLAEALEALYKTGGGE